MLNIGRLDQVITIQQSSELKNNTGEMVETWADLAQIYSTVTYDKGNEKEEQARKTAVTNVSFTVRYRNDISEKMRIKYNENYYKIHSILEKGRREYLLIKTEKRF